MYTPELQQKYAEATRHFIALPATVSDLSLLRDILVYHEYKYYVEDDPMISDHEYDILYKQLVALEEKHPELITQDSPTQRVSSDISGDFPPVQHLVSMLSLDNSYNEADLNVFDTAVKKLCNLPLEADVEYAVEPKFDGGSIALVYENDVLIRAATRGNGIMGEDMTPNARSISSIPLKAAFSKYGIVKAELRGEALIRKDNFDRINQQRQQEGLPLFANPRNAATGGLRTKDPSESRKRGLEAFIYQLGYAIDKDGNSVLDTFKTHNQGIKLLGELGFKVPKKEEKVCKNINEVHEFVRFWEAQRDDYSYEIDGMVIKVNSLALQEQCGSTSHHPRWAIAFKFKAKQATSKLIKVEYQVGRIGTITPVAKIEPVYLAGVTVSSISLHNEDFIQDKDLRIGDTVLVERAGDVIPYIVKSFPELRNGSEQVIEFPRFCPINSSDRPIELVREDGEVAWRCPNHSCGAQTLQRMIYHASKEAMDIEGMGKSVVERFYGLGMLKDISDFYKLDYDVIAQLEGFGVKSAENLKKAVDKAKKNSLQKVLVSLGIHHLGKRAAKLIAEQIGHLMDLKAWNLDRFLDIKDIGPVVAQNIIHWFSDEKNVNMLEKMDAYGVNLAQSDEDRPREVAEDGVLFGKTILFTGTLQHMGRKEAEELAAKAGAKNLSAVSSNLNILVVGEKAGSKLKKAQALGTVEIWTEEEFLKWLEG
ncbi:MAG: NAD-dependent DNA ligase LigA [Saprospiraceae bacterium]|nr:NAD-dependent DNA ligase LigA [Saprospiraceae bacterium]MCZ2339526.1 NAD-dependent DNA ligase LigA [Chitinophagales bacterium]